VILVGADRRDRTLLKDLIGALAAEAFYAEFAGTAEVTLPKADKILAQLRDAAICADQDHSLMELAVMYRLTSRQIQNIRARGVAGHERGPDPQFDLFSASNDESHPGPGSGRRLNAV
jgi:Mor family transcriptional regulator